MSPILELRGVSRRFGGLGALSEVDLAIEPGEILGLIGPNGAGKTTLVNVVTGVHRPSGGSILFDGERIDGLRPHRIARRGIARTYQVVQPFPAMTVLENVAAAALFAAGAPSLAAARGAAAEQLRFVGLERSAAAPASELTLADRKRLELAKSLAMRPRVLFLDEVNAGLNPAEIDRALDLIRRIAARGVTVVLIEHLMKVVMALSTRIAVLHHGELIAEGPPREVAEDPRVVEAYLGARFARLTTTTGGARAAAAAPGDGGR